MYKLIIYAILFDVFDLEIHRYNWWKEITGFI